MKTTGNTVLITGASAGIGFEIAKQFVSENNRVIITGRNLESLKKAKALLGDVTIIQGDVSNASDMKALVNSIYDKFPELNLVINNAGRAFVYNLSTDQDAFSKAQEEMLINYLSIIRLNENLLPLLKKQPAAAIVNVSSIGAFSPFHRLSTYASSKAALHSYTQALRFTLSQSTSIKVFELMPPLVNTEFSREIGGEKGISAAIVAADLIRALENDEYEIHVGQTADFYKLYLSSPAQALLAINNRS